MRTYPQFRNQLGELIARDCDCPVAHALECISPKRWHDEEIIPLLESGEQLPLAVCRSIVQYGGGFSLLQLAKRYPNAVPSNANLETGKLI